MGGLETEDSAIPAPSSLSPLPSDATARGQLALRRRRAARRAAACLAVLLVAAWWVMRAETRPLREGERSRLSSWLDAALEAPRALVAASVPSPADPPRAPAQPARVGSARLAHGPTASATATTLPASEIATQTEPAAPASPPGERTRTPRTSAAPAPAAPPEPAPASPSKAGEESAAPGVEIAADVDLGGAAPPEGTDVLVNLSPGDFQGALDPSLPVGSAGTAIDVQLEEGAIAVDTSLRVDTPEPGLAGPTYAGAQIQLEPNVLASQLALGAAGTRVGIGSGASPERLGADVALDVAGTPAALAVAAQSEGVAIDLSTGDLVPVLLGGNEVEVSTEKLLPIDLPLDLDLRLH